MLGFGYCLMVSWLFCFLCFTSSVSLTSFYTEDEPILSLHCKGKFSTYKECKHLLNERIYSCLKKFISSKNISTDLNNSKTESTNTCQHQLLAYWVIVCGEMYPEVLAGTMAAFSDMNESRRDVARGGFQEFWNPPVGLWKWILSQEEKRIGTPL